MHDSGSRPGDGVESAVGDRAEYGAEQFATAGPLAFWAGMCPGNFESAGKWLSSKTRKGSAFLRRHLCQAAWAVSTKRGSYLAARFGKLAARRGNKRATMAVGHAILVIAHHLLKRKESYRELGPITLTKRTRIGCVVHSSGVCNGSAIPLPSPRPLSRHELS